GFRLRLRVPLPRGSNRGGSPSPTLPGGRPNRSAPRTGAEVVVPPGLPQDLPVASRHGRTLRPEPATGELLAQPTLARPPRRPRRVRRLAGARPAGLRPGRARAWEGDAAHH